MTAGGKGILSEFTQPPSTKRSVLRPRVRIRTLHGYAALTEITDLLGLFTERL
jgi:hypothetical protein